jgi:hypothetical protein
MLKGTMLVAVAGMVCALAGSAGAAVLVEATFDDLTTGDIDTQSGGSGFSGAWSASAASSGMVISGGLDYTNPTDGGTLDGGTQALSLENSSGLTLSRPFSAFSETVYVGFLFYADTFPNQNNEVFLRLNGWNTYVAAKYPGGGNTMESRIGNGTQDQYAAGPSAGAVHLLVARLTYDGGSGNFTQLDTWLDPAFADLSSPDSTLTNDNAEAAGNITGLDFRFYNRAVVVDELRFAQGWDEIVPPAVPEPATLGLLLVGGAAIAFRRRAGR